MHLVENVDETFGVYEHSFDIPIEHLYTNDRGVFIMGRILVMSTCEKVTSNAEVERDLEAEYIECMT